MFWNGRQSTKSRICDPKQRVRPVTQSSLSIDVSSTQELALSRSVVTSSLMKRCVQLFLQYSVASHANIWTSKSHSLLSSCSLHMMPRTIATFLLCVMIYMHYRRYSWQQDYPVILQGRPPSSPTNPQLHSLCIAMHCCLWHTCKGVHHIWWPTCCNSLRVYTKFLQHALIASNLSLEPIWTRCIEMCSIQTLFTAS